MGGKWFNLAKNETMDSARIKIVEKNKERRTNCKQS